MVRSPAEYRRSNEEGLAGQYTIKRKRSLRCPKEIPLRARYTRSQSQTKG